METIIFTDGSSRGNPGRGGYGAICAYQDLHGVMHVAELGGREAMTTNNRMELQGLISALDFMKDYYGKDQGGARGQAGKVSDQDGSVGLSDGVTFKLYIDSAYVLNGAKTWLAGWKRNNWITSTKEEVKNGDLWQILDNLLENHKANGVKFDWNLIKGHAGTPGNERCDEIATGFADANDMEAQGAALANLYRGSLAEYPLGDIFSNVPKPGMSGGSNGSNSTGADGLASSSASKKSSKGVPAFSYISYVDGQLNIDKTWAECEKRVRGKSGARFKKSTSKENEDQIVADFTK